MSKLKSSKRAKSLRCVFQIILTEFDESTGTPSCNSVETFSRSPSCAALNKAPVYTQSIINSIFNRPNNISTYLVPTIYGTMQLRIQYEVTNADCHK